MQKFLPFANFSDSRNPFVEYALQYAVAAAHAIIGKTNGEKLQKLLLLGTFWSSFFWSYWLRILMPVLD